MLALAGTLQALTRAVRRARSAMWCGLTMTLNKELSVELQNEIDRLLSADDSVLERQQSNGTLFGPGSSIPGTKPETEKVQMATAPVISMMTSPANAPNTVVGSADALANGTMPSEAA